TISREIEYLPSEICGIGVASDFGLPVGTSAPIVCVVPNAAGIAAANLRNSRRSCRDEPAGQSCERCRLSSVIGQLLIILGFVIQAALMLRRRKPVVNNKASAGTAHSWLHPLHGRVVRRA